MSSGILAGRTASMMHPVTMLALFLTSAYSGYLGLQWRRLRGLGEEIKDLSSQLPKLSSGPAKYPIADSVKDINAQISSLSGTENAETKIASLKRDLASLQAASAIEIDAKIGELSKTRKDLLCECNNVVLFASLKYMDIGLVDVASLLFIWTHDCFYFVSTHYCASTLSRTLFIL
jgi:hypothetical protein